MSKSEASAEDDGEPPPSAIAQDCGGELLPTKSIRHIMKRSLGAEHDALTREAIEAVQRCTSETVSMIVSEARLRATRQSHTTLGYADIMGVLSDLRFGCVVSCRCVLMRRRADFPTSA